MYIEIYIYNIDRVVARGACEIQCIFILLLRFLFFFYQDQCSRFFCRVIPHVLKVIVRMDKSLCCFLNDSLSVSQNVFKLLKITLRFLKVSLRVLEVFCSILKGFYGFPVCSFLNVSCGFLMVS